MRTLGILLLSLTPLLFGLEYKTNLRKYINFITIFKEFVIFAKEQIRFTGRERDEIFALATMDPRFNTAFFKSIEKALKHGDSIEKIIKNSNDIRLKNKDIQNITAFISGLGKSDTEGEIAHCDYYISLFENDEKRLASIGSQKSKLTLGLALSLSAAMFIIMI